MRFSRRPLGVLQSHLYESGRKTIQSGDGRRWFGVSRSGGRSTPQRGTQRHTDADPRLMGTYVGGENPVSEPINPHTHGTNRSAFTYKPTMAAQHALMR